MFRRVYVALSIGLLVCVLFASGCKDDASDPIGNPPNHNHNDKAPLSGEKTDLPLTGSYTGTCTLAQRTDGSTLITIRLSGSPGSHPSHLHDSRDKILFDLTNVNGDGSAIETDVPANKITYEQIIKMRGGYIAVHASSSDFTVIARADF